MNRKQVDKYLGCLVAITFSKQWFNDASQSWVRDDEEYIGFLIRCRGYKQEKYYELDSEEWLPTHNACWGASRMRKIRLIEESVGGIFLC